MPMKVHHVFDSTFGTSKYRFTLLVYKLKGEEELGQKKRIIMEIRETFTLKRKYVVV
jgi:hypothetical protein